MPPEPGALPDAAASCAVAGAAGATVGRAVGGGAAPGAARGTGGGAAAGDPRDEGTLATRVIGNPTQEQEDARYVGAPRSRWGSRT